MLRLAWVGFSPDGPSGKRWYQQPVRGQPLWGRPTPRGAYTLEELVEGGPLESGDAPDRRRPLRPCRGEKGGNPTA